VPPIVYLTKLRMSKARYLLTRSDLPISEIAGAVGMELGYFSRMFKQMVGYAPSTFRKSIRDSEE